MSDELLFADEENELAVGTVPDKHLPWKIMIVDDEPEIHAITKLALGDFAFNDRSLTFVSAYSGVEARQCLAEHPDTALILLDVVMETEEAGLGFVRHVREALRNTLVRIVLRTGQPGQAPERQVILDYDINDYKTKTELTSQKLFTTLVASLRSYRDLETIHQNRLGLEKIILASASIFEVVSMERFVQGVLTQLVSLLRMQRDSFYCSSCFVSGERDGDLILLAGTGSFETMTLRPAFDAVSPDILALLEAVRRERKSRYEEERLVIHFEDSHGHQNMIYMEAQEPLQDMDKSLLEVFCSNVAIAFSNIQLKQEVDKTLKEISNRLSTVAEARSLETGQHVQRVVEYSRLLARLSGIGEEEADLIGEAAALHDIGKVGIPDHILNKPGKLTEEEFAFMTQHAMLGYRMFADSERPMLRAAAIIARDHHERYAGGGYPAGTAGEDIHIYGRIVAIADCFDALSMDRVYKKAWPLEQVRAFFEEQQGTHFDPRLTQLFLGHFDEFAGIRTRYADGRGVTA